jgi:hypothetical protein
VSFLQRELRLVVIVLRAAPGELRVAVTAFLAKLAGMQIVVLVAAAAARRGGAERLAGLVAGLAADAAVRTFEFEIRARVIEACTRELDDVAVAALVHCVVAAPAMRP